MIDYSYIAPVPKFDFLRSNNPQQPYIDDSEHFKRLGIPGLSPEACRVLYTGIPSTPQTRKQRKRDNHNHNKNLENIDRNENKNNESDEDSIQMIFNSNAPRRRSQRTKRQIQHQPLTRQQIKDQQQLSASDKKQSEKMKEFVVCFYMIPRDCP